MKASDAGEDVPDAALGDVPDVDAATTAGTVVDVLVSHVVVVVVLDGAVVVVEVLDGAVVVVVLVVLVVLVVVVVIVVVVVVVAVVEVLDGAVVVVVPLGLLVEVVVEALGVDVLVVVLVEHGAVVVEDGTVEVVVLVDVLVVVTAANPLGATAGNGAVDSVTRAGDRAPVVVAAVARLPTDRVAERTTDPKMTFINRTEQRGIRQSFPPPACTPVRVAPALGSDVCNQDARWYAEQMDSMLRNGERFATFDWWSPNFGGPIRTRRGRRRPPGTQGAVHRPRVRTAWALTWSRLTRILPRCHAELTVFQGGPCRVGLWLNTTHGPAS